MKEEGIKNFIQANSSDGGFLQSDEWKKFQESVGKKTFNVSYSHLPNPSVPSGHLPLERGGGNGQGEGDVDFWANIIEHQLPVVGRYFYIPRGPVIPAKAGIQNLRLASGLESGMTQLAELAEKNKAGWIRIEPANEEILNAIKKSINYKIAKAPHDMQPREILVMDITKSEEQLLSEMKSKTRYNIKLAEKKEVRIKKQEVGSEYVEEFLRLTRIMTKRQGIQAHPDEYYRKMLKTIPENMLKLYIAEYQGKVIAANLVVFFGNTCTYLHGASDDDYRNVMVPYLLQWKHIQDAKVSGCEKYDFGGVKTYNIKHKTCIKNSWEGITRFKLGFVPNTKPMKFPGSYDIIVSPVKYWIYRIIQKIKNII